MAEQKKPDPYSQDVNAVLGLDGSGAPKRRWGRWAVVAVLAAGATAFGYVYLTGNNANGGASYITDPAARSNLTVIVTATGTVEPTNQVDISSELSGTIRKVMVDYNSRIKKGEILAELDTDKLKASVESSRAKLAASKAQLKKEEATRDEMKLQYERKRRLVSQQVGSGYDLDTAKAAYDRALAAVESARADVAAAAANLKLDETNLSKSCICSPINGIVLSRNVDPGQTVASSLQAPVLFTIAEDLGKMEVQVDVDEADVGKVREGQSASFTVDAYADKKFQAKIKELRFGSLVVQGVVTYKAVLTTDNSKLLLRPGMTATAEIVVEEVAQALTVANAALRFSPPNTQPKADNRSFLRKLLPGPPRRRAASPKQPTGSGRMVWVFEGGELKSIPVTIGSTDGQRTQILKGDVKPGQKLIVDMTTKKK